MQAIVLFASLNWNQKTMFKAAVGNIMLSIAISVQNIKLQV